LRVSRRLLSILAALLLLPTLARAVELATIDPDDLVPGEPGYGLSVFQGTTPERFEITVIGVLKNALAGQDLVLIRCAGKGLEHAKIVAGMSGSPIYVRDRLVGALAYGWAFSADPIAGVTPIKSMLAELKTAALPPPASPPTGLTRLLTPLLVSGVPSSILDRHEAAFRDLGFLTASGTAPISRAVTPVTTSSPAPGPAYAPGSAIAVDLVRGDLAMSAIGTVTHVAGDRALAFGHPFNGAGVVSLPAAPARILTVLPRLNTSFKLGSPLAERGSMVWDGQAAIAIDAGKPAKMVPVAVRAIDRRRGTDRTYRCEVAANPNLTPVLVQVVIGAVLEACGGSSDDVTTHVKLEARYSGGRTLALEDSLHAGREALFTPQPLARVLAPLENLFGRVRLDGLTCDLEFTPGRKTALLRRAWLATRELKPGRDADLAVVLQPYEGGEVTRTVRFRVPREAAGAELEIQIQPGAAVPPDVAAPENVADVFAALAARHRATDVVLTLSLPGRALHARGRVLKRLPRSVMPILEAPNQSGAETSAEITRVVERTPWVVQGALRLKVPVKEVALE
jgi:hypothetical protein